jgi:hypothetical protein
MFIVDGNCYPLLIATNIQVLFIIMGYLSLLSFSLSLSLIYSFNSLIVSFIGLFLDLFIVLLLSNSPYKYQQCFSSCKVLKYTCFKALLTIL